jgi:hypothetical protein
MEIACTLARVLRDRVMLDVAGRDVPLAYGRRVEADDAAANANDACDVPDSQALLDEMIPAQGLPWSSVQRQGPADMRQILHELCEFLPSAMESALGNSPASLKDLLPGLISVEPNTPAMP